MGFEPDPDDCSGFRTCRICLDSSPTQSEGDLRAPQPCTSLDDQFVSPCACTGTQAFVHLRCLRRWQISVLSSRHPNPNYNPALICTVCTQRFTIPPPKRALAQRLAGKLDCYAREVTGLLLVLSLAYVVLAYHFNMRPLLLTANDAFQSIGIGRFGEPLTNIKPGTVLVASPSMPRSPSAPQFYRSVVLVYEHGQGSGTLGVILNKPLEEKELGARLKHLPPELASAVQDEVMPAGWGGPVAGWTVPVERQEWLLLRRCPECVEQGCLCGCTKGMTGAHSSCGDKWRQLVGPALCLTSDISLVQQPAANEDGDSNGSEQARPIGAIGRQVGSGDGDSLHLKRKITRNAEVVISRVSFDDGGVTFTRKREEMEVNIYGGEEGAIAEDAEMDNNEGETLSFISRRIGGSSEGAETSEKEKESRSKSQLQEAGKMDSNVFSSAQNAPSQESNGRPNLQPKHLLLVGRAGWREGQLAAEIRKGWWAVHSDAEWVVLNERPEQLWHVLSTRKQP